MPRTSSGLLLALVAAAAARRPARMCTHPLLR